MDEKPTFAYLGLYLREVFGAGWWAGGAVASGFLSALVGSFLDAGLLKALVLFGAVVFVLAGAFVPWDRKHRECLALRERQQPTLNLSLGSGGSYFQEIKIEKHRQRLFRVGITNSGSQETRARVVIESATLDGLAQGLRVQEALRIMGTPLQNGDAAQGWTVVSPAQVPTAYADVIWEDDIWDATGGPLYIPYAVHGELELQAPPDEFFLTLRVDGGPQSTFLKLRCTANKDLLALTEIHERPLGIVAAS